MSSRTFLHCHPEPRKGEGSKSLWSRRYRVVMDFFVIAGGRGSLEAGVGWGSGEARVVSDCGQKNRCQCQFNGHLRHLWSERLKQSFLDGKQAILGVSCGRPGWSKRAFLSDMDGHVNVH